MKLFYSYMWRLFAHIPTLLTVVQIPLKIFSPANQRHRLVMPGRCFILVFCFTVFSLKDARPQSPEKSEAVSGSETIKPLLVGQQVPEEFWTKEHLFYVDGDTVKKNLEEYRGSLLVLDFWATWCAICLHQMGAKQSLFSRFPDKANLLFVNPLETKDTYASILGQRERLSEFSTTPIFTSIIEDKLIQQLFPNHIYPRYVWIGPRGNLIGLTTARFVTEENLKEMLGTLNKRHENK